MNPPDPMDEVIRTARALREDIEATCPHLIRDAVTTGVAITQGGKRIDPRTVYKDDTPPMPWVVVAPFGVYWLGHAENEARAWCIALGWPDEEEVARHKAKGWYAAQATVTWSKP